MEEIIQTNPSDSFPPKPELNQNESMLPKLIFSLALFALAYYVFFDKDIKKMALLVLVLLIHELGHFLAMKAFRYTDVKMFFIPFLGALVTGEKQEVSQRQRAIILLAGPVPGIIIGAVLAVPGVQTGNHDFVTAAGIFILLNAANLLPLTPLDGGKLIETLFFSRQAVVSNIFSVISAVIMTVIAIRYKLYSLLIIPFFMITRVRQLSAAKQLKQNLTVRGLEYNKPYDSLSDREYWLIREQLVSDIPGFTNIDGHIYQPSSRERQIIQQVRSLHERQQIQDLGVGGIILFSLIWFIFLAGPIAAMIIAYYR